MLRRVIVVVLALTVWSAGATLACDGTAIQKTNPVTGNMEKVCPVWDGHDYEIYWYEKVGTEWRNGTQLTDDSADDVAPHFDFDDDGSTGVAWRKSGTTGRIYYRGRQKEAGTWTWQASPVAVSPGTNDASAAWVTFRTDGTPWIGWHALVSGGSTKLKGGGGDAPDPWPTSFTVYDVATTEYAAELLLEIRAKDGCLWLVWVDSSTQLGYAEWSEDAEEWGITEHEYYDGASDIPAGKQRVEDVIVP